MQSDIVTHVRQHRPSGPYPLSKVNSVAHQLMRVMGFVKAQGIDHQRIDPFQQGQLTVVNGLHIGDIGKRTETITHDGHHAVHHLYGQYLYVTYCESLAGMNLVQFYLRHTRVAVLGKTVRQHLQHALTGYGVSIHVNLPELTIGSDIIHSPHVVVVRMGYQYAVNPAKRLRQYLFAKVGTCVHQQSCLLSLHQYRAAQTLVLRVRTLTHPALTAYHRHATRCSRTKKRYSHQIMFTSGSISMSKRCFTS